MKQRPAFSADLEEMTFQPPAPLTKFMGQPIKTQDDIVPLIQQYLKVSGTDATDSVRKAIDALTSRTQSRMTKQVLGDLGLLAQRMRLPIGREHYLKLQKAQESQDSDEPMLSEINMSPAALAQFASHAAEYGVRAGFEAELLFTKITAGGGDEYEPDYESDESINSGTTLEDLQDFYSETMSRSNRVWARIEEEYLDAVGEKAQEFAEENFEERAREEALDGRDIEELEREALEQDGDLSDEDIERILDAGRKAPTFWSSKEQRAYREANPDYDRYWQIRDIAEEFLSSKIEELRDEIEEQLRDEFYQTNDYSLGDWLNDQDITSMYDLSNIYELDWPHWNPMGGEAFDMTDMEQAAGVLEKSLGKNVRVSGAYHDATRDNSTYIIEPDSSLSPDDNDDAAAEVVSPPMPLDEMMQDMEKVFDWAENRYGAYTNRSTGLHVGVSLPDMADVDYVKLALLLGDEYVLKQFNRSASQYTESVFKKIAGTTNTQTIAQAVDALKKGLVDQASTALKYTVFRSGGSTGKYVSINWRGDYIEFRSMGADYLSDRDKIVNTIYRYVRALVSAADANMDRREYLTRLYKVIQGANTNVSGPKAEPVNMVITKYLAGDIGKEEVIKYKDYLRQAAQARKQPGMAKPTPPNLTPQRKWKVVLDARTWMIQAPTSSEAIDRVIEQNPDLVNRYRDFEVTGLSGSQA